MLNPGATKSGLIPPLLTGPLPELLTKKYPPCPTSAILPTVITAVASPGDPIVPNAGPLLPAAHTTTIPSATAAVTANLKARLDPPIRLIFITFIPNTSLFNIDHITPLIT